MIDGSFDQVAVVPYRRGSDGLEFCLVTARQGDWIFPKGFIDPGETPPATALKEAWEEAGLRGRVVGEPLGTFEWMKLGQLRSVIALLMEVSGVEEQWLESSIRLRRWVDADAARRLLQRPALRECLERACERLQR